MKNPEFINNNSAPLWQNATGKLPYMLTNDFLFKATLQRNNKALKGLICAVEGLEPDMVKSVEITNPIELGKDINSKDFYLDVRVLLNDNTIINMEMQVVNLGNWPERSLGYLCRSFDNLNKGEEYEITKPVVQVCFLDFTLFEDTPDFYSEYMFMNVKKHKIYSDKLKVSVVDLTQIDKATEEDKRRELDYWARLFKATTWEEIRMLASKNEYVAEAAETVYQLSAEEKIRLQCEARERYNREQSYIKKQLEKLKEMEAKEEERLANLRRMKADMQSMAADKERMEADMQSMEADMQSMEADMQSMAADKERMEADVQSMAADKERMEADMQSMAADMEGMKEQLSAMDGELAIREKELASKTEELAAKDALIARLQQEILKRSGQDGRSDHI